MTIDVGFHEATKAEHTTLPSVLNDDLQFRSDRHNCVSLYVPPHVAEHTAAAFNRAMQAVPDRDAIDEGWTYTAKSGLWHIRCPMPRVYLAQHDEVTGDGDPSWMFAEASTLIGVMDEIDRIEAEEMEDAA